MKFKRRCIEAMIMAQRTLSIQDYYKSIQPVGRQVAVINAWLVDGIR